MKPRFYTELLFYLMDFEKSLVKNAMVLIYDMLNFRNSCTFRVKF